ncbi:MAG: PD-(D/E)XK nuclease family protein [Propionibacteriaceae bacterium]|nr:PD-(D/E)XK nuclease family protein [Propionibacteriaceae bacterium]
MDAAQDRLDLVGQSGVETFLAEIEGQAIPSRRSRPAVSDGAGVALLTAHRGKGREWPLVVVAGVQEGVWPDTRQSRGLIRLDGLTSDGRFDQPDFREGLGAERRLFLSAVSRASRQLLVTAADDAGDWAPSRFLDDLGLVVERLEPPGTTTTSLVGLVGRWRRLANDPDSHPILRDIAVARLADLAQAHDDHGRPLAPTADPATWWGAETAPPAAPGGWDRLGEAAGPALEPEVGSGSDSGRLAGSAAGLSGSEALGIGAGPSGVGRVGAGIVGVGPVGSGALFDQLGAAATWSPSQVQELLACPRRWFLSRRARAEPPPSPNARLGQLIHALARRLAQGDLDREQAGAALDQAWERLGLTAPWRSLAERAAAEACLERYRVWLEGQSDYHLVGLELPFAAQVEAGEQTVRLVGRLDRVDRDDLGRLRVVDLKTARRAPSAKEVEANLQLGLYQAAVAAGGLGRLAAPRPSLAGAELVYLRLPATQRAPRRVAAPDSGPAPNVSPAAGPADVLTASSATVSTASSAIGSAGVPTTAPAVGWDGGGPKAMAQANLESRPHLEREPVYPALSPAGRDRLGRQADYPTWVHQALAAAGLVLAEGRFPALAARACSACPFRPGCPARAVDEVEP